MRFAVAAAVLATLVTGCSQLPSVSDTSSGGGVGHNAPPVKGMSMKGVKGVKAGPNGAATSADLLYYGGPVISNVDVVAVMWGGNVDPNTTANIGGFFGDVTNSSYFDFLSEYNTNIAAQDGSQGTNQTIGRGTFNSLVTITPGNTSTSLQDSDIQTEITNQIAAGTLPQPTANTLYMTYFDPTITITMGGQQSCQAFCAYHGTIQGSGATPFIYYGVMPDLGPNSACSSGCGDNTGVFDNLTEVSSHELIESVTDAAVGLATGNAAPLAWYDQNNGEIGDICVGVPGTAAGHVVQKVWSNAQNNCIDNSSPGN